MSIFLVHRIKPLILRFNSKVNSKCCVANLLEKNPFSVFKFVCLSLPSISRIPTKVVILKLGDIVHDSRCLSPVPKLGTDLSQVLLRAAGPGI